MLRLMHLTCWRQSGERVGVLGGGGFNVVCVASGGKRSLKADSGFPYGI